MIMKSLFAFILLLLLVQPAFAQLMPEDIRIIREEVTKIVREEVTKIVKAENDALEKRLREYVDLKFENLDTKFTTKFGEVDKRLTFILILVTSLIASIVLAVGIPQILITLKQKDQSTMEAEIKTLQEKVELLEQTRLVRPN